MRFGDAFVEHGDGTLDVLRTGAKESYTFRTDEWSDVQGDQPKWKKSWQFWK